MADQTLLEIKDRLNIADVIGGYIKIKKAGGNFKALCPFHNEKTPSLQISPGKQIWHCFGCGAGGDVFGFVMQYENLDFKDALKILAGKAGVKLPEYRPRDQKAEDEKDLLYRINDFAARYFHQILLKGGQGREAMEYLQNRGLDLATIKQWQIGYAPEGFHNLEQALAAKGVRREDMVKAGVCAKNERGQIYDRFRGRVTFPIFDSAGKTVGFSARILRDDGQSAKYINSPETVIYNKSKVLFGLNFAKTGIRKRDEAIVVEGQMDCISLHQAGFTNVVASSGTALTAQQLDSLSRLTKNLKFCFDTDAAGLAAARRAVELYLGRDFIVRIIKIVGAKDPDELVKKDKGLWEKLSAEAPLFMDFYLEQAFTGFDGKSVEQKKQIAKEMLPLVGFLTDPLEQDHYLNVMAAKLNTTEKVLRDALKKTVKPKSPIPTETSRPVYLALAADNLEKEVFGGMLVYGDFLEKVLAKGKVEDFSSPEIVRLLRPLFAAGKVKASEDHLQPVKRETIAKEGVFMVESMLEDLGGNLDALKKQLEKSFAMLHMAGLKKQQQQLAWEIKKAEGLQDKARLASLNQEFMEISQERLQMEREV